MVLFSRFVWLHLVKIGCWEVAEKSYVFENKSNPAARDTFKLPILPPRPLVDRGQNFLNFCGVRPGSLEVCWKDDFSDRKPNWTTRTFEVIIRMMMMVMVMMIMMMMMMSTSTTTKGQILYKNIHAK